MGHPNIRQRSWLCALRQWPVWRRAALLGLSVGILQAALTERGEPQAVTMHPGKNHFTLLNRELMQQIHNEMAAHFRKHYTAAGAVR